MELEKLATSAVITEISKTDCLTSFINSGDKEPCWDGHIYIHEDSQHTKKNLKKVATQVKGKAVTPKAVTRTISYPISYDDLYAYMMNGGTMFFVVYLDKDNGTPLQVYYKALLPFAIKDFFKVEKRKYTLKFHKFPTDKIRKTELFLNFYEDSRKQASFAGMELPTIDDLTKQGVLESLSISYTGIGDYSRHSSIPKMLDGSSITIYANIKGGSAPIPVEYCESISHITMSRQNDTPITVDGTLYYTGYQTIITSDFIEHHIGSSVIVRVPNPDSNGAAIPLSVKISLNGTLSEQIASIEFITAMVEHGSFHLGTLEIPSRFSDEEFQRLKEYDFPKILDSYYRVKSLLDKMNVQKDLEISKCTDEDIKRLNILIGAIEDGLPVRENPGHPANIQKMTIANLTLAVVYLERENEGYNLYDYFGTRLQATWAPNSSTPVRVSQFFSMGVDDYLTLDNINLDTILEDFKAVPPSDQHLNFGNTAMLTMLKAYDRQPSTQLLKAAQQLCEWQSEFPEYISSNITILNRLQIVARERTLTFQEKAELYPIASTASDTFQRIGAFLLLDEQDEARRLFKSLSSDELNGFREFPIYKFYKYSEEE